MEGKTNECLSKLTFTENHWSNIEKSVEFKKKKKFLSWKRPNEAKKTR